MSINLSRALLSLLLLSLLLLAPNSGQVLASDRAMDELFDMSLEELLQLKVASSTLYDESIQSVPSSVTVFKHDEIQRLGISRLTELMNYVPGFQSYQIDASNLTKSFSSRGHRVNAVIREVLILIDGHRLNSDWTGGTTFFNSYISMDNVEQVEFIRGPGSAIYGSNAFLGVISIKTKGANLVEISGGSNDYHRASFQKNITEGDFEFSLLIKDDKDHGESLSLFNPATNSFTNSHDPSNNQEAYLTSKKGNFEINARWAKREMEEYYNGGFISNEFNERFIESYFIDLNYNHQASKNLALSSTVFFDHKTNELVLAQSPDTLFEATTKEEEMGVSVIVKYDNLQNTRWLTGLEIRQPDILKAVAKVSGSVDTSFPLSEENPRTIRGLFSQYQSKINDSTNYLLGARLDDYSNVGSHFSPRAALIHAADTNNSFKLLYGEAFRAPSRLEIDLVNAPGVKGNPDLDPEISKTVELIWVYMNNERILTSTLFDMRLENTIVETTEGTSKKFINGSDSSIAGLELELQQAYTEHWHLRLAATHIFDKFSQINSESSNLLSVSINYSRSSWSANISANYQSEKFTENLSDSGYTKHDGYTLFDTNVVYRPAKNSQVSIKVKNILDKDYNTPSTSVFNTEGVQNRGRTAEVSFKWYYQ